MVVGPKRVHCNLQCQQLHPAYKRPNRIATDEDRFLAVALASKLRCERKEMICKSHELSVTRQARIAWHLARRGL